MRIIIGTLALLSSTAAQADLTATYAKDKEALVIEANDDGRVRLNSAKPGEYTLLNRDGAFVVLEEGGAVKVAAMADFQAVLDEMMAAMWADLGMDPDAAPDQEPAGAKLAMEKAGEETVNGRRGIVYREMRPGSDGGEMSDFAGWDAEPPKPGEVVLSDDATLAPLGEAWSRMVMLVPTFGRVLAGAPSNSQADFAALLKGKGVLRMDDIALETVAFEPVDEDRFVLPAAPMSRAEVKAMLDKGGE